MALLPHLARVVLITHPGQPWFTVTLAMEGNDCAGAIMATEISQVGRAEVAMTAGLPRLSPRHLGTTVTVRRQRGKNFYTVEFKLADTSIREAIGLVKELLDVELTATYQYHVQDATGVDGLLNAETGGRPGEITFILAPDDPRDNIGLWRQYGRLIGEKFSGCSKVTIKLNGVTVILTDTSQENPEETLLALARLFTFN